MSESETAPSHPYGPRWVETHRGDPADFVCGPLGLAAAPGGIDCCGHPNLSHVLTPCPACQMEVLVRDVWQAGHLAQHAGGGGPYGRGLTT